MYTLRKPEFLRRITTRLGVEPPAVGGDLLLSNVVVPIVSFDDLFLEGGVLRSAFDVSAASGYTTILLVPQGKRYKLVAYQKPLTSGAGALRVQNGKAEGIPLFTATTGESNGWMSSPVRLEEGWIIDFSNTNNGGDTARTFTIFYLEEDAY